MLALASSFRRGGRVEDVQFTFSKAINQSRFHTINMMFPYTHENHFKFGYKPAHWFSTRTSPDQEFTFEYGSIQKEIKNWREANRMACRQIRENFSEPLWILLSGGTDSECTALSFVEAGIPFRLASLRMKNERNEHDLKWALEFAKEKNLDLEFFDLDVEDFLQSPKLFEYTDPIQCVSPVLACHLWLADQVDGVPIFGQGECYLKKEIPSDYEPGLSPYVPSTWNLVESERLCTLYLHFIQKTKPAVPGFFQYLPEQIDSFLRFNPWLKQLVTNQIVGKLGTRTSKNKMIREFYPEIKERPKFTGFEKIQELHDRYRLLLASRYPHSDQDAFLSYENTLRMLRGPR